MLGPANILEQRKKPMRTIKIASHWFNAAWILTFMFNAAWTVSLLSMFAFGLVLALLFALPAAANVAIPYVLLLLLGGVLSGAIGYGTGLLLVISDSQRYGKLSLVSPERAKRYYAVITWAHAIVYLLAGLAIIVLLSWYLTDNALNSPSDILGVIGSTLLAQLPEDTGNLLRWVVLAILCYTFAQSWNVARFHKNFSPAVYLNQSKALLDAHRFPEALVAAEQAIQLDPNFAAAYVNKGSVLVSLQRYQEALDTYDQAIQRAPNHAGAYNNKGAILYKLQRYEEALAAAEHSIQLDPDQANSQDTRGAVLIGLQRYEEAGVALDRALQLDPQAGAAYYHKGLLFQQLGQTTEAEQAFEKARELGYEEE
jgi:Tfp pilus assembly protein PilF